MRPKEGLTPRGRVRQRTPRRSWAWPGSPLQQQHCCGGSTTADVFAPNVGCGELRSLGPSNEDKVAISGEPKLRSKMGLPAPPGIPGGLLHNAGIGELMEKHPRPCRRGRRSRHDAKNQAQSPDLQAQKLHVFRGPELPTAAQRKGRPLFRDQGRCPVTETKHNRGY